MKYLLLSLLIVLSSMAAANTNTLINSVNQDLKQAQNTLNRTQQTITKEKRQLTRQLSQLEQKVSVLREQAQGIIRAEDESALSLKTLEERLNSWQAQQQYQGNLFARFASTHKVSLSSNDSFNDTTKQIDAFLNAQLLNTRLLKQSHVVLKNGERILADTLKIGPQHYFVSETHAGFATTQSNYLESQFIFNDTQHAALKKLIETGYGSLPLDPSNGRALTRIAQQETISSHVAKGGIWVFPILFFALFALSIVLFKLVQLIKLPKLDRTIITRLRHVIDEKGDTSSLKVGAWQQTLIDISQSTAIGQSRDDQLFNELNNQKKKLDNFLGAIAVTAAVAPLLGLLGTVSGMIDTFKLMTLFGAGDPAAVSGGISEALVTTELGLVVAIPALLGHALLSRKVKSYYHQLEQTAISLSQFNFGNKLDAIKGVA